MDYSDLIGLPFRLHGRDRSGIDCYGLIEEWYRRRGVDVKDATKPTADLLSLGWKKVETPEEGDVCMFSWRRNGTAEHCGIYLAGGKVLHALRRSGVCIARLVHLKPWLIGVYRPCHA